MRKRTVLLAAIGVVLGGVLGWWYWPAAPLVPDFTTPVGKFREPLPYRIVSFHRGRADKNLIKLAHQLGFNGVQFQIEGSNVAGLMDFSERDAEEHLVDYCHSLGMQVTVWVHELSDLPGEGSPEFAGPVAEGNEKLWAYLSGRYEWLLTKIVPNVDGLVLTVVETDVNATSAPLMKRVVGLIRKKCEEHGKSLIVRTFVWTPEEFAGVMGAVRELPPDTVVMSKIVPQDWQMRGGFAAELGAVGSEKQIVEFDVAGEYFLRNSVANCMVGLLKKQMDYAVSKGAAGICVRVDREDSDVLFTPNEVNLWALGMWASGAANDEAGVWDAWAKYRYGEKAAAGVKKALEPTGGVVAEMLSIGPFTFGDTRSFPPLPSEDPFSQNWQNWKWDKAYGKAHSDAELGEPAFVEGVAKQKAEAAATAAKCLADLEAVKGELSPVEYAILRSKLEGNRVQLSFRAPMAMAALHYRAWKYGPGGGREAARKAYLEDVAAVRAAAMAIPDPGELVTYKQRVWRVGAAEGVDRDAVFKWAFEAGKLVPG